MGGRGGSSSYDWRNDAVPAWETPAERKAKAEKDRAEIQAKFKAEQDRLSRMSESERKAERLKNLQVASDSLTRKQSGQKQKVLSIGGRVFHTAQEIDNYYDNEYKKGRDLIETTNAMNRALGTSGGVSIAGKIYTSSEQLRKHYKAEAKKSKDILSKL